MLHDTAGIITVGIGLAAGLLAGWVTWAKTREADHSEHDDEWNHLVGQAVQEHIRHRALQ